MILKPNSEFVVFIVDQIGVPTNPSLKALAFKMVPGVFPLNLEAVLTLVAAHTIIVVERARTDLLAIRPSSTVLLDLGVTLPSVVL